MENVLSKSYPYLTFLDKPEKLSDKFLIDVCDYIRVCNIFKLPILSGSDSIFTYVRNNYFKFLRSPIVTGNEVMLVCIKSKIYN
jgi:hypothetical protein